MGSDPSEVQETPSLLCHVKVHLGICKQLLRLVERISCIIPEIEAARPGSSQGLHALCMLQKANDRAREHVQNCDSSKLYLALTGDEIVKRIKKTNTLLIQSLSKLQNMVPTVLASQIMEILNDLQDADFCVDLNEALAGKALKALLEQDDSPVSSIGDSEIELLQFATSALQISSKKDILIERRSLKKLIGKTREGSSKKRKILTYFLHILKMYDQQIVQGPTFNPVTENGQTYLPRESDSDRSRSESKNLDLHPGYARNVSRASVLQTASPPEEFKCYFSSELMHDPVVISSGQTFERLHIQKWFDEGNDTCPKTKIKLPDLSVMPNTSLRDLILRWSMDHGINISEPRLSTQEYGSLETSYNSISSSASSSFMGDIHLRIDLSGISLGSLDSSCSSMSNRKLEDSFSSVREVCHVDSGDFQFYHNIDDIQRRFLSNVNQLPWESQCRAVQEVNMFMINSNPSCSFVSSENFLDPLVRFLQDAIDNHDLEAQKVGNQLLLTFLSASRTEISQLNNDVYTVLASLLTAEPMAETLSVIEVLSTQADVISHLASSGVLTSIIKLLDVQNRDFKEAAIKILYNLSSNIDASSCKYASDWISKLVPFLEDGKFAGTCVDILGNLSKFEEPQVAMAKTDGCIASIIRLLEMESSGEIQEHAVDILLFLCTHTTQRSRYCHLLMDEGGVMTLCHVSVNGTVKGKSIASELLRQLRDIEDEEDDEQECPELDDDAHESRSEHSEDKSSKTSRLSSWKMKIFSKKR